ncbi:MAG: HD domain-containing protein [Acidobacteria bacterium]|nr:HD domain-containing protein [Acidobacteriota bacterium]
MATAPSSLPGFTEQNIVLPQRLWNRLEQYADDTAREPGEVVAEALRLLFSGAVPTAAASVSGVAAEDSESAPIAAVASAANSGNVEMQLADVTDEAVTSDKLFERLCQVMEAVDKRDGFTGSHSRAVSELALALAKAMDLPEPEHRELEIAALVHDLGKVRVPEEILGKRGRLTADEWALVKQYPEFGAEMLAGHEGLQGVRQVVSAHQERWDGSGYPNGHAGDDIAIAAQIVGLCDVYTVLTSERSYRPALAPDTARRTIESGAGRLWNPELVRKLIDTALK